MTLYVQKHVYRSEKSLPSPRESPRTCSKWTSKRLASKGTSPEPVSCVQREGRWSAQIGFKIRAQVNPLNWMRVGLNPPQKYCSRKSVHFETTKRIPETTMDQIPHGSYPKKWPSHTPHSPWPRKHLQLWIRKWRQKVSEFVVHLRRAEVRGSACWWNEKMFMRCQWWKLWTWIFIA